MYLSRLYIENYRSIKHLDISFTEWKNVIVWKNNAWKSNIISAIDLVLWENSPTYNKSNNILETDFYGWIVKSQELIIICEINITQWENPFKESTWKSFILQEKWRDFKSKELNSGIIKDILWFFELEEKDFNIRFRKRWLGYWKNDYDELLWTEKFIFAFEAKYIWWVLSKNLICIYKKDDIYWVISGNWIRETLIQSAIIPSFRDPSTQLKISNWWWYWKILREKIKTTKDLEVAFDWVNKASEWIFSSVTADVFDSKLSTAFPWTTARFSLAPLNQDIYKQALIYIDDWFESTLQSKWSWIQSAVIISLFDYYIKHIVDRNGSALLAVEEPELFLHPHGRRVIAHRLDQFIGNGTDKKNQVIVTTHASEFIAVANNNLNIISVRKESWETDANNYNFWDDKKIRQILLRPQNTELFFSDFVILTEDAKLFIEEIARELGKENPILWENWLNDNNISVVNSGWKQEFWKFAKICEELKIPYVIFADFDFIRWWLSEFYTQMFNFSSFNKNKDKLNWLCWKINVSDDFFNKRMVEMEKSTKPEIEKDKEARKYKRCDQIDIDSQKLVKTELLPILAENNIYISSWELEDLYLWDRPKHWEQWVIEVVGELDDKNKLSDKIDDSELRNILNLVIVNRWIKLTDTIDKKPQEEKLAESIVKPVAALDDREDYFRTKYWRDDDISIDDIPF